MNLFPPVETLRQQRAKIIARWARQLDLRRRQSGWERGTVNGSLLGGLYDEVLAMLETSSCRKIPRCHSGSAFDELADFPESVSLCIDVLETGAQVIGAYVVENSGMTAIWSASERNRCLDALDRIFHVLVHREIETLCELCLHRDANSAPDPEGAAPLFARPSGETNRKWYLRN